jgi:hypothetical protein
MQSLHSPLQDDEVNSLEELPLKENLRFRASGLTQEASVSGSYIRKLSAPEFVDLLLRTLVQA